MCLKKKVSLIILGLLFWTTIPSVAWSGQNTYQTVHIFADVATTPSLLQMVAYLKAPPEDLKIILWRRFQGYDKGLKENTIEVTCPNSEHGIHICGKILKEKIKKIYKSLPKAEYVIHGNNKHFYTFGASLLSFIPQKQIRMIHLYEDGNATKWRNRKGKNGLPRYSVNYLKQIIKNQNAPMFFPFDVILGRLYPLTVHCFFAERMQKDDQYAPYMKALSTSFLENVDYVQLSKELSEWEKERLFQMAGFDYKTLKKLFQKKKNVIIVLPIMHRNSDNFLAYTRAIGFLMSDGYKKINPKEYTFFYKPHPAINNYEDNPILKKRFPGLVFLPKRLPYELLILGGFKIDFVFGVQSSLFYTLSPEQVLYWFPAHYYTSTLKALGLADENKQLNLNDFKKNEE